jgi:NhaP-type Na+/H+ or K+/H+ antiporter
MQVKLNEVIVFSVLFPPMIFAQGYTLHKSVLFKNGKYILLFGVFGTFTSFLISWGLIYEANSLSN